MEKIYSHDFNKNKFLYIRHGETNFNKDIKLNKKLYFEFKKDLKYLDINLNEQGIKDAINCAQILKKFNIINIYSSPLNRCLQTSKIICEQLNLNNKIIVHPLLNEIIESINDFIFDINEKKLIYNEKFFDWNLYNKLLDSNFKQNFYFIEYLDNLNINIIKNIKQEFLNNINNKNKIKENLINLIKLENKKFKKLESLNHLFYRNLQFKKYLRNKYSLDKNINNKVLIITHSNFIKISTSQLIYNLKDAGKYFPKDSYQAKNCEILSININN